MGKLSNLSKNCVKVKNRMSFHRNVQQIVRTENLNLNKVLNNIRQHQISTLEQSELSVQNEPTSGIETISSNCDKLRFWSIRHNITKRAVNDLLRTLKKIGVNFLPKDSRSLCKTPRTTIITPNGSGKYWYNGIEPNIRLKFPNLTENIVVQLNFNVDGVPLFKSSGTEFWPILANIHSKSEMELASQ